MAEAPQQPVRRRWRFQFSLRAILVVMALIGATTVLVTNHVRKEEENTRLWRFHQAVLGGDLKEVDRLLKLDPRLAHQREKGGTSSTHTPLQQAFLFSNNPAVFERILKEMPDINERSSDGNTILHLAVERQMLRDVVRFLQLGADANAQNKDGESPLHFSAMRDRSGQITQALLDSGADANLARTNDRQTAFHVAIQWGNASLVRPLLSADANVNARDDSGRTPLHLAMQRHDFDVARLLLANGADLTAKAQNGMLPGSEINGEISAEVDKIWSDQVIQAHDTGETDRIEALLTARQEAIQGRRKLGGGDGPTPLHQAVASRRLDIVDFLLKHGTDVNARGADGVTPLHVATTPSTPTDLVVRLLDAQANINATTDQGQTALHFAALRQAPAVIQLLIERGTDKSIVDNYGATALDMPFEREYHGDAKKIQALLVKLGMKPTVLYAAATGDVETLKRLSDGDPTLLDREYTRSGIRPLHAAVLGGQISAIEWLLRQGVDRNARRPPGYLDSGLESPLMMAISYQAIDIAIYLIDQGVDVNVAERSGHFPIHAAIEWERDPVLLKSLVAHGADVTVKYQNRTAAEYAQSSNSMYREQYLQILTAARDAEAR
jgi:ankyrin repeat protein